MAAWLLGELSEAGRFGELPPVRRMRAIESALFMVGYELPLGALLVRAAGAGQPAGSCRLPAP